MDPNIDNTAGCDQRRFDLLVDGELSAAERADLLGRLDHEPEGWRRCALAFLEAQCWKQELGAIVGPAGEQAAGAQPAGRRTWRNHLFTAAAMAASFLFALVLGTHWRDAWTRGTSAAGPDATSLAGMNPTPPEPATVAARPVAPASAGDQWEMVTLTANGGPNGAAETFRVPAVHRDHLDQQWLDNLPGAIPPEMLEAFERSGHEVRQQRELVPMEMKDGRRLIVPVDRIEVQYVGRPSL